MKKSLREKKMVDTYLPKTITIKVDPSIKLDYILYIISSKPF